MEVLMATVLLGKSALDSFALCASVLGARGYDVVTTFSGQACLASALSVDFAVIILDIGLSDISVATIADELRDRGVRTPILVISPVDSIRAAVAAIRAGVRDVVCHPVSPDELIDAVETAIAEYVPARMPSVPRLAAESHAARRWARIVVQGAQSSLDPKTLDVWAHEVGVSYGTLRNWCHTAALSPRDSLSFVRLLRAVILRQKNGRRFQDLLDIVDLRTLRKLLRRGGLDPGEQPAATPIEALARVLHRQRLIQDREALAQVRALLSELYPGLVAKTSDARDEAPHGALHQLSTGLA
jgi:DNA-binding response OmpR family regulator